MNVGTEYDLGTIHISRTLAGFVLTIPVAVFLVVVWALHLRHRHTPLASACFPIAALLVLASTYTGNPAVVTAVVVALLVTITVVTSRGPAMPSGPRVSLQTR